MHDLPECSAVAVCMLAHVPSPNTWCATAAHPDSIPLPQPRRALDPGRLERVSRADDPVQVDRAKRVMDGCCRSSNDVAFACDLQQPTGTIAVPCGFNDRGRPMAKSPATHARACCPFSGWLPTKEESVERNYFGRNPVSLRRLGDRRRQAGRPRFREMGGSRENRKTYGYLRRSRVQTRKDPLPGRAQARESLPRQPRDSLLSVGLIPSNSVLGKNRVQGRDSGIRLLVLVRGIP